MAALDTLKMYASGPKVDRLDKEACAPFGYYFSSQRGNYFCSFCNARHGEVHDEGCQQPAPPKPKATEVSFKAPEGYGAVLPQPQGGIKHDTGKAPVSLIPRSAVQAEAEVLAFGARKYAAHNWRGGMKWSRLIDATLRHVMAFNDGEDVDPESGLSHLAHARTNLGFLIEYLQSHPELDDRYKREEA